ncbi:hypothetical protein D3C75_1231760 [compost metagenome]
MKVASNSVGSLSVLESNRKGVTGIGSPGCLTDDSVMMEVIALTALMKLLFPAAFAP